MIAALRFSGTRGPHSNSQFCSVMLLVLSVAPLPAVGLSKGERSATCARAAQWPPHENHSLSYAHERGMLLTLLLIAIAMLFALGTALYLAYVETETDFPIRHKPHHGVRA